MYRLAVVRLLRNAPASSNGDFSSRCAVRHTHTSRLFASARSSSAPFFAIPTALANERTGCCVRETRDLWLLNVTFSMIQNHNHIDLATHLIPIPYSALHFFFFFIIPLFAVRRRVPTTTIFYIFSNPGPVVSLLVTFFLSYVPVLPHILPILV